MEAVERLRQLRPETYPESRYPPLSKSRRYRNIFDFCMDTVTIDRSFPQIGDGGSWPSYGKLSRITWHDASAETFEHAYRLFRDPKFAWALAHSPGLETFPGFPVFRRRDSARSSRLARRLERPQLAARRLRNRHPPRRARATTNGRCG